MSAGAVESKRESREDALAKFKRVFGIARAPAPVVQVPVVPICHFAFAFIIVSQFSTIPKSVLLPPAFLVWCSPALVRVTVDDTPYIRVSFAANRFFFFSQSMCGFPWLCIWLFAVCSRAGALSNHQAVAALAAAAAASTAQRRLVLGSTLGTRTKLQTFWFRVECFVAKVRPFLITPFHRIFTISRAKTRLPDDRQ
jgi:hypothetical protein